MLFVLMLLLLFLGGMELIYRLQLIDCYRGELIHNNTEGDLQENTGLKTLLIMGDSFAVQADTFALELRKVLDGNYRTINSAVAGSGVLQAALMAPRRFRRFHPSIFLYQIYVGNDLFDLRYPSARGRVSSGRNLYWLISTRISSLAWLNYKMGQVHSRTSSGRSGPQPLYHPERDIFSPESFTKRDRIHALAEPSLVADSVLLRGRRREDFGRYLGILDELLNFCQPDECRIILLVIPHFSQTGPKGADRARKIGLRIPEKREFFRREYPFLHELRMDLSRRHGKAVLINPLPVFQESEASGCSPYYQNDSHLNSLGQSILAGLVLKQISPEEYFSGGNS